MPEMKNLRKLYLSVDEQADFDPLIFTTELLRAGFKFDHLGCPVKITKPWDRQELPDGTVLYRQWDE